MGHNRCIFLDRDGTINVHKGLITNPDDLEIEPCAANAIRLINASGFLAIVITNQSILGRGMCSIETLDAIHGRMMDLLENSGAHIDDLAYCPHYPHPDFPGANLKYAITCHCRKPDIGMLDRMAQKHNIDISQSYLIGDSTVDLMTGQNANLTTVLVKTGQAGEDGRYAAEPKYVADNLLEAVRLILNMEDKLAQ